MKFFYPLLMMSTTFCGMAHAAELSFLSGGFRKSETEAGGTKLGSETILSAGLRYGMPMKANLHIYGAAKLGINQYSEGSNAVSIDNSTDIILEGGARYYFGKLGENLAAFASGYLSLANEQTAQWTSLATAEQKSKSGLFYGARFGLRMYMGDFFADFEVPLTNSALSGTDKTVTLTRTPQGTTDKQTTREVKTTELYAQSFGDVQKALVSIGMKL